MIAFQKRAPASICTTTVMHESAKMVASPPAERRPSSKSREKKVSNRVCQSCGRNRTTQWRYDRTGTVLLCNGCGIRWRRVSGTEGRRIRPGPKATSTNTIPSFSSNIATPATFKPRNDAFRGNSSGGCTPPRKSGKGLTKSTEKLEPSSKMALKHLLCDTTAWRDGDYYRNAVGHHTPRPRSAESASMRINNLIDGDGRGSGDGRRAMSVDSSFQLPPSIRWRQ